VLHDWLKDFFYKEFHIIYDNSVITSNFYTGVLKLTPAEVAYLLVRFSEFFNLPLTELIDNMEDFSCYDLVLVAKQMGKKYDKNSGN
jgi:hypothetical protein